MLSLLGLVVGVSAVFFVGSLFAKDKKIQCFEN